MLPEFVGGAVDFGALAAVNSFTRLLHHGGCSHAEAVAKEEFSSAEDVVEATSSLRKSVRNFISLFWIRFGWAEEKKMPEARRAEVCIFFCYPLYTVWLFPLVSRLCFCRSLPRKRRRLTRLALHVLLVECILRPRLAQRILKLVPKFQRDPKLLPLLRPRCEGCFGFRNFLGFCVCFLSDAFCKKDEGLISL